jgi:hypothetical protein
MGPAHDAFGRAYPGYRAEAQVLGQDLFHLGPNLYTQFLFFVSVVSRYVPPPGREEPEALDPYACGCGEPSADDWAQSLTPDAREREAVRRALAEGWIGKELAKRLTDPEALERRIYSLPGAGGDDATVVPEVMAAFYRREAERYLLRPPPQRLVGEATTPTTLEEWEPGDALRDVDWPATLSQRGPLLGAAQPLKRLCVAEAEGWEVPLWQPRVEIYLDVSGSMPDPRRTRNAMTLAAQVLLAGAIRAGGRVRAALYSGAPVLFWEWSRSEAELSRLSISFSRGFGLTASQLGVALVRRDHPWRRRYGPAWTWLTYFYNALAARAFRALEPGRLEGVDRERRAWVRAWLGGRGLPAVESGSYYVKSFRVEGEVPPRLARWGATGWCGCVSNRHRSKQETFEAFRRTLEGGAPSGTYHYPLSFIPEGEPALRALCAFISSGVITWVSSSSSSSGNDGIPRRAAGSSRVPMRLAQGCQSGTWVQIALSPAISGMARNRPAGPQTNSQNRQASITVVAFSSMLRPMTTGTMTYPSRVTTTT